MIDWENLEKNGIEVYRGMVLTPQNINSSCITKYEIKLIPYIFRCLKNFFKKIRRKYGRC